MNPKTSLNDLKFVKNSIINYFVPIQVMLALRR